MARCIVIANQKGGVGKTTTAVNLAAALAVMEKKTLVIDCDPQGNAGSGLGIYPEDMASNLYSILYEPERAEEAVHESSLPYLHVVPSTSDLVAADIELVDKKDREKFLSKVIEQFNDQYEFILLDCPPSLGLVTLNALCAASELLVPLQCEYYALEGVAQLLKTFELVRRRFNTRLQLLGVVMTMYDGRNKLNRHVKREIRRCFPKHHFETVIPRNVRVSEAPSHGLPVISYDVKSKGAESYMTLAREILCRVPI